MEDHKSLFYKNLNEYFVKYRDAKKPWNYKEMEEIARDILLGKQTVGRKTRRQYHLMSLYDTIEVDQRHVVIRKRSEKNDNVIYVTPYEELFDVLYPAHIKIGHGARDKMTFAIKKKYQIPRPVIEKFVQSCEVCCKKRNRKHADSDGKSIISPEFCSRGQVDLIDYRSCQDGEYCWLLVYEDQLTKFVCLRPLRSDKIAGVAVELLKIFLEFGAPAILQSDHGDEFVDEAIAALVQFWPDLKIIRGRSLQSQPQDTVENCGQDVQNMLQTWMQDKNSTNWSMGCYFVQFQKNSFFHKGIRRSPYKAMFGIDRKIGLNCTNLPDYIVKSLASEDDLDGILGKLPPGTNDASDVELGEAREFPVKDEPVDTEDSKSEIVSLFEEKDVMIEFKDGEDGNVVLNKIPRGPPAASQSENSDETQ